MTKEEDFKALVRTRMAKTGESYTTAREQLLRQGPAPQPPSPDTDPLVISERVGTVFARAARESEFSEMLHSDPEGAGRSEGLTGTDLFHLVGEIRSVQQSSAEAEATSQVLRDIVHHRMGRPWPFAELDSAGLAARAQLGAKLSERLLIGLALETPREQEMLLGLGIWARALEDEVRGRAKGATEVDLSLADALVGATRLRSAVARYGR